MPVPFYESTADDVVASVEAVVVGGKATTCEFVGNFADIPVDRAERALHLATELGLISHNPTSGKYSHSGSLCTLLVTPDLTQKAAVVRIVLESYEPFVLFKKRLKATDLAANAAQQTKVALDLDKHRDVIKDTLISLGTYSHALETEGGGRYRPTDEPIANALLTAAQGCANLVAAEGRIRVQMGDDAADSINRDEVLVPLANALLQAGAGDGRQAVVLAGNAVDSYLTALAGRLLVNLAGATGINAKLDKFGTANKIPKKLIFMGKYLGHVRNAADHGIDADVNAAWQIQATTGLEYVYVTCSFISALYAREVNASHKI